MLQDYFTFEGRATRLTYVVQALPIILLLIPANIVLTVSESPTGGVSDGQLFMAAMVMLAGSAVTLFPTVRRLHDLDMSGWWMLISIVPLLGFILGIMLLFKRGTWGENRYGWDPLDPEPEPFDLSDAEASVRL